MDIVFEPLSQAHYALLLKWLEAPHVKRWWDNDIVYTLDLVKEKFGNANYIHQDTISTEISKKVYAYLVSIDNEKIGYIQAYNAKGYVDDTQLNLDVFQEPICGIDLFIGEKSKLYAGLGAKIINAFIDQLLRFHYTWCLIDPAHNNTIAIKAFEKAGFEATEHLKTEKYHWMLKKIRGIEIHNANIFTTKHIEELELRLLDPKVRKSSDQLNKLLADDFYEIGASGKVYNKKDIISLLPTGPMFKFELISNFTVAELADGLMLIGYDLKEEKRITKRTSIWRKNQPPPQPSPASEGGSNQNPYQMIFHQGTIVQESNYEHKTIDSS